MICGVIIFLGRSTKEIKNYFGMNSLKNLYINKGIYKSDNNLLLLKG